MSLRRRAGNVVVLASVMLAVAVLSAAKIKVTANRETSADFSTIKTYLWLPSPPPTTDVAPGVLRDPLVVQKEIEPTILAAIDRELAAHGWRKVQGPDADVQIVYYLAQGTHFNSSTIGEYYQYATGYALIVSPFVAPTDSVSVYEEGSLIIDIVQDRKAIWRGTATAKINRERSDEKRRQVINDAVQKLIDKLPAK